MAGGRAAAQSESGSARAAGSSEVIVYRYFWDGPAQEIGDSHHEGVDRLLGSKSSGSEDLPSPKPSTLTIGPDVVHTERRGSRHADHPPADDAEGMFTPGQGLGRHDGESSGLAQVPAPPTSGLPRRRR